MVALYIADNICEIKKYEMWLVAMQHVAPSYSVASTNKRLYLLAKLALLTEAPWQSQVTSAKGHQYAIACV